MGEYAMLGDERIKIGTRESMYYLRATDAYRVEPIEGSVDPAKDRDWLRFRFPWPEEDGWNPGDGRYVFSHGIHVSGIKPPSDSVRHYNIQFSAPVGLLVNLPCPNGDQKEGDPVIHRNGYRGDLWLSMVAFRNDAWRPIYSCGACGAVFWQERERDILVAQALGRKAEVESKSRGRYLREVAHRVLDPIHFDNYRPRIEVTDGE